MTDKSDHLIERAAALLRSGNAPRPPERAEAGPGPAPGVPPRSAPPDDMPPRLPPGVQPILVAPPRTAPVGAGLVTPAPSPPVRPRPASGPGGAASDLRAAGTHPLLRLDLLERAGLMVARNKRTRTAEEYRIVIGRVLRALHEEPEADPHRAEVAPNVVM